MKGARARCLQSLVVRERPRSSSVANTTDGAKEIPTGDLHQLPEGHIKHV